LYGSFAIASPGPRGSVGVLERCGSTLKLPVGIHDEPFAASSDAIVWAKSETSRRLHGPFLPSLRRFVIATPIRTGEIALSSGELNVVGWRAQVFAARAPGQDRADAFTRVRRGR
jgi:hypothetical protein